MYYRPGDVARSESITSEGFMSVSVGSDMTEFLISGRPPYTNHTIHVRAVGETGLLGDADLEFLSRTHSSLPTVVTPVTTTTPAPPSTTTVIVVIADPRQIDTGRVM